MAATRITGSVNMKTVIFPVVSVTMVEHRMQHELPLYHRHYPEGGEFNLQMQSNSNLLILN